MHCTHGAGPMLGGFLRALSHSRPCSCFPHGVKGTMTMHVHYPDLISTVPGLTAVSFVSNSIVPVVGNSTGH